MSITFSNDNDVIVYALECIIDYARRTQQIFVAQCVWWLASITGFEQGLISHIDNPNERRSVGKINRQQEEREISNTPRNLQGDQRVNKVLSLGKEFVEESKRGRYQLRSSGRVNPLPRTKVQLKRARKVKDYPRLEGIADSEISRRQSARECLCCAWPSDRKLTHRVTDCIRPKLHKGTAPFATRKPYEQKASSDDSETG
jgi:hypothetical protein